MATNPKWSSKFLIQDPHFFKVVMFPFDQGLRIPDAFMSKYGRHLQDVVLLKVPTGASWPVELVRYGDGTLLQKGWEEFADYYSIKKFYFLVFRYKGNSQFHVLIFDPSALEIEYPIGTSRDRRDSWFQTLGQIDTSRVRAELQVSDDDEDCEEISAQILEKEYQTTPASKGKRAREEDVSIEVLDDLSQWRPKTRSSLKLTTESPQSKRKNTVKVHSKPNSSGNGKAKQNQNENSGCSKQKMNKGKSPVGTRSSSKCSTSISSYKTVTDKEKFKTYEKAKAFTSSNPFFISFMQPYYVSSNFYLEIPRNFVRSYLSMKKKREYFMLHVSGRTISWPVTMSLGIFHRGTVVSGWKEFVEDNGLRVGDVCVFELVPGTKRFNVTIYSSADDEISP